MCGRSVALCPFWLLVVLCVVLGFNSRLLSLRDTRFKPLLLSALLRSLDLVRLMPSSSIFDDFLGILGPDSISTSQLGLTEPGAACAG